MPDVTISLISALTIHTILSEEIELLVRSDLGKGAEKWIETLKETRFELFDAIFTCRQPVDEQDNKDNTSNHS